MNEEITSGILPEAEAPASVEAKKKEYKSIINTAIGVLLITFVMFQLITSVFSIVVGGVYGGIRGFQLASQGKEFDQTVMTQIMTEVSTDPLVIYLSNFLGALAGYPISLYIGGKMLKTNRKEYIKRGGFTGAFVVLGIIVGLGSQCVGSLLGIGVTILGQQLGFAMNTFSAGDAGSAAANVFMVLFVCILGPVFEECVFRGLILRAFSKVNVWFGIILSSVLFGLYHGNPFQLVAATLMGISFALVASKAGTIVPTIIMHIIMNVFATVTGFMSSALPEEQAVTITLLLMAVLTLAGIVAFIMARKQLLPEKTEKSEIKLFPILMKSVNFWIFIVIMLGICTLSVVGMIYMN